MNAGGAIVAKNVLVSLKDSVVLDAGCGPLILSQKNESHVAQCVKLLDGEETSVAMVVFAAPQIGLRTGPKEDNDFISFKYSQSIEIHDACF